MKIQCEEFRMQFEEFCDRELADDVQQACEKHLEVCARCSQFYNDHAQVDMLLSMLPVEKAPEGFTQSVMDRWGDERQAATPFIIRVKEFFQQPRIAVLTEMAALFLVVLAGYYLFNLSSSGGGIATTASNGLLLEPVATMTAMAKVSNANNIAKDERDNIVDQANSDTAIANTIGPDGVMEMAAVADGGNPAVKTMHTPTHDVLVVRDDLADGFEPAADSTPYDSSLVAVSAPGSGLSVLSDQRFDRLMYDGEDISKSLLNPDQETRPTPNVVIQKIFEGNDYEGISAITLHRGAAYLFERAGGQLQLTQVKSGANGSFGYRFSGQISEKSIEQFENEVLDWHPVSRGDAGNGNSVADVARMGDKNILHFEGDNLNTTSGRNIPGNGLMNVSVVVMFYP